MSLTTAFNWRHKLLNNICKSHKGEKLSNEVSIMKTKIMDALEILIGMFLLLKPCSKYHLQK